MNVFSFQESIPSSITKGHLIVALAASMLLHGALTTLGDNDSFGEIQANTQNESYRISVSMITAEESQMEEIKAIAQEKIKVKEAEPEIRESAIATQQVEEKPKMSQAVEESIEAVVEDTKAASSQNIAQEQSNAISQASSGEVENYRMKIIAWLEMHKKYPRRAEKRGIQGVVTLQLVLDKSGEIISAIIAESSGFSLLDSEVLFMLQRATPLPKAPDNYASAINMTIPIEFYLQ